MSEDCLYCEGCGRTLEMWDPNADTEGDEMWIMPNPEGEGEIALCEGCYAAKLQKK